MNQFAASHALVASEKCIAACVDFYNTVDKDKIHLCNKEIQDVYNAGEMAINIAKWLNKCK